MGFLILLYPTIAFSWTISTSTEYDEYPEYFFVADTITTVIAQQKNNNDSMFIKWTCPNDQINDFDKKEPTIYFQLYPQTSEKLGYKDAELYVDKHYLGKLGQDYYSNKSLLLTATPDMLKELAQGKNADISYRENIMNSSFEYKNVVTSLVHFSLKGSALTINEATETCQQAIEMHTSNYNRNLMLFWAVSGSLGLVGLWIGWILIKKVITKLKKMGRKATYATHGLIVRTQQQRTLHNLHKQEAELKKKFAEAALDEIAREAVRKAMREDRKSDKPD